MNVFWKVQILEWLERIIFSVKSHADQKSLRLVFVEL